MQHATNQLLFAIFAVWMFAGYLICDMLSCDLPASLSILSSCIDKVQKMIVLLPTVVLQCRGHVAANNFLFKPVIFCLNFVLRECCWFSRRKLQVIPNFMPPVLSVRDQKFLNHIMNKVKYFILHRKHFSLQYLPYFFRGRISSFRHFG